MQDLNEIRITGTLFKDPTFQTNDKGGKISRFSVGIRRSEKNKMIDFLNVVAWNEAAEFVKDNFHEKDRISVKGRMHADKYTSQDGIERRSYRIFADEIGNPENETLYFIQMKEEA